ncbi:DUF2249 domain-containing protein [Bradyrhizobium lablabi]|uniref:DUF2249 domain-containing protein n=1 Tax=Bradyrhizobium lablabi TaxID=722472 RepID=UPI001FD98FE2|nr:DUF2249 domain-containing protein [Bradyrhizobium lablabi]
MQKIIDVRQIARPMRHALIFDTFEQIGHEGSFDIVSDHNPRPLHYLFDVKYPGAFTWDYVESGPDVWRVRIGRAAVQSQAANPVTQAGHAGPLA